MLFLFPTFSATIHPFFTLSWWKGLCVRNFQQHFNNLRSKELFCWFAVFNYHIVYIVPTASSYLLWGSRYFCVLFYKFLYYTFLHLIFEPDLVTASWMSSCPERFYSFFFSLLRAFVFFFKECQIMCSPNMCMTSQQLWLIGMSVVIQTHARLIFQSPGTLYSMSSMQFAVHVKWHWATQWCSG